jgi:hypothetical protein
MTRIGMLVKTDLVFPGYSFNTVTYSKVVQTDAPKFKKSRIILLNFFKYDPKIILKTTGLWAINKWSDTCPKLQKNEVSPLGYFLERIAQDAAIFVAESLQSPTAVRCERRH